MERARHTLARERLDVAGSVADHEQPVGSHAARPARQLRRAAPVSRQLHRPAPASDCCRGRRAPLGPIPCARHGAGVERRRQVPAAVFQPAPRPRTRARPRSCSRCSRATERARSGPSPCWRRCATRGPPTSPPRARKRERRHRARLPQSRRGTGRWCARRAVLRATPLTAPRHPARRAPRACRASACAPSASAASRSIVSKRSRDTLTPAGSGSAASARQARSRKRVVGTWPHSRPAATSGRSRSIAAERPAVQAAAAHLRPRERGAIDEQHRGAGACEAVRGDAARGSGADDDRVPACASASCRCSAIEPPTARPVRGQRERWSSRRDRPAPPPRHA